MHRTVVHTASTLMARPVWLVQLAVTDGGDHGGTAGTVNWLCGVHATL